MNSFGAIGLVSRHTAGGSTIYTFDPAGNVAQRLDSGQNVLSTAMFDAFGTTLAGGTSDPFGFGAKFGYYTDGETGLQLLTHRYYDAAQGRFLNRDPGGYSDGINLYAYADNSGPNGVDPSGTNVYRLWCGVSPFFGLFYAHVILKMADTCSVCPFSPFEYASFFGGSPFGFSYGKVEFGEGAYQDTDPTDKNQYCSKEIISDDPVFEQLLCMCIVASESHPPVYTFGFACGSWAQLMIYCAQNLEYPRPVPYYFQ